MDTQPIDAWTIGAEYERYVGRWSRKVAPPFLEWVGMPPQRRWLEVGCGTGAMTRTILERCGPAALEAVEPSEGYLQQARAEVTDDRVRFHPASAEALPLPDDHCDAAVSGLMLNFVSDQARAVAEQRRVVVQGGTVAAYVWDYAGRMELMRHFWDAAVALDNAAVAVDEGVRFPIARSDALAQLWRETGLTKVETRNIDVETVFPDFEDYWSPFLGGQGPAPGYCMSLSEDRREALRERLRSTLPTRPDGSIHLIARALAVKGTVP